WDCARCCCVSCCCATEVPARGNSSIATAKRRRQTTIGFIALLLFRPSHFVLVEIAGPDGVFPARLVAFGPLRGRVEARGRVVVPGLAVRLPLVLALLVDDHLLALAACLEPGCSDERRRREDERLHDFAPAGAAF